VALEANDVYGEPVNIANRIQQLAQPGEILFNEATFHAMTRSEVPHEVAGDFDLKGVNGQVRLYRALSPS
jgi:class 3 adenylate cyclase